MRAFLALVVIGFSVVLVPPSRATTSTLEALIAKKVAILGILHRKASKALVTAAQDDRYSGYFVAHSDQERLSIKGRIDQISLQVQRRFQVEEMCLINPEGAEISRIVGNMIADDLATEEASAIFFRPGFDQAPRKVHVSPIYMSPDAHRWVIAYVTPILVNGEKRAILHYEHNLGAYQNALNKGMDQADRFILAVNQDGWIVSDSRRPIAITKRGDHEVPDQYFERFMPEGMALAEMRQAIGGDGRAGAGVLSWNGATYSVAYKTIEHWTVFAFEIT